MTSRPAARVLALLVLPCLLACADDRALLVSLPDGAGTGGVRPPGGGTGGAPSTGGFSGTGGATGGKTSTGGAPGTGGIATEPTSCSGNFSTCGGNLVGTWTVTSTCLAAPAALDVSRLGLGCSSVPAKGTISAQGSLTFYASGAYTDDTTTFGQETLTLPASCLNISGTRISCQTFAPLLTVLGYASASCANRADGGCDCDTVIKQAGSLGYVALGSGAVKGSYTSTSAKVVFDGVRPYPFCASADKLILMTPPSLLGAGLITLARTSP